MAATAIARRAPIDWTRKYSFATGLFYLITFAASIPAAFYFITPVLNDPNYIVSSGADTRVVIGCLLDAVNALAALALGFVTTRMFEAAVIMVGVLNGSSRASSRPWGCWQCFRCWWPSLR
jgi:hypothetical protein